jgi:hypothetical protein
MEYWGPSRSNKVLGSCRYLTANIQNVEEKEKEAGKFRLSKVRPAALAPEAQRPLPQVGSVALLEKEAVAPRMKTEGQARREEHKKRTARARDTAGTKWFDLPKTEITKEIAQNLKLLKVGLDFVFVFYRRYLYKNACFCNMCGVAPLF